MTNKGSFSLYNVLFTGDDPWGRNLDDATLLRAATKLGPDTRRIGFRPPETTLRGPLWRVHLARFLFIWPPPMLFLYGVVLAATNDTGLWVLLLPIFWWWLLIAAATGLGTYQMLRWWRGRLLRREVVIPTAKAVRHVLGVPKFMQRHSNQMVQLGGDFDRQRNDDKPVEPVRIMLPAGAVGDDDRATQRRLLDRVGATLGMPNPEPQWQLRGSAPFVLLRPASSPPERVHFAAIKPHLEKADLHHPIIGMASGMRTVGIDYLNDSPHVLISGGSGTGKSVLVKGILAQRMHHGAGLVVLDFKRVSHLWAHDLPGCAYAWQIEDIPQLAVAVGEALQNRIGAPLEEYEHFRAVDVLVEEANSLMALLQQYWKQVKDPSDPVQSPAVAALQRVIFMGREMGIHGHWVSQRASTRVFGADGGDARENFTTRLMAKWTMQTWRMLCGGIPFRRWPGGGRGVWARVQDDDVEIVRTALWTDAECRDWATSGEPCLELPLEMVSALTGGPAVPKIQSAERPAPLVTLSQALPQLPGPDMSLSAIRKYSTRDLTFPKAVDMVGPANQYRLPDLIEWKARRDAMRGSLPIREHRAPGLVYAIDTINPATGQTVLGYIGQTRQALADREAQHRETQPWADLMPGPARIIWQGEPTDAELDTIEVEFIRELKPLYNFDGQEGADHAMPKWQAVEARHARDRRAGREPWEPLSQSQWRAARLNQPIAS